MEYNVIVDLVNAVVIGLLHGITQGMIMTKPIDRMHDQYLWDMPLTWSLIEQFDMGVRGHIWFLAWYHWLFRLLFLFIGIQAYLFGKQGFPQFHMLFLMFLIIWTVYEFASPYTRYKKIINPYPENVLGLGIYAPAPVMYVIRSVLMIFTLIGGILL
jgi:hypothetical protein